MSLILAIGSSCDGTAAAVFDNTHKKLCSSVLFSQVSLHAQYGGVVPEIASRSHIQKITPIVHAALQEAGISLEKIDTIAVTAMPGLVGSLLIGLCFGKGLAWAGNKKLIGVNHLEGHIFSSFLNDDGSCSNEVKFPHVALLASGGHTALYLVTDFGVYELIGQTLDDAAGEALDKVAKLLGLGYPGGPVIEKLAQAAHFEDVLQYPRTKNKSKSAAFSFSGLKTAVLYDLVNRGAYDFVSGVNQEVLTDELKRQVASSLLVCMSDIFQSKLQYIFKQYPEVKGVTFVGGVACNKFLRGQIQSFCERRNKFFRAPHPRFCGDNAAMVAFVGGYKENQGRFSSLELDVFKSA